LCGQLDIGSATNIRKPSTTVVPISRPGGAGCGSGSRLADGDFVAYKVTQPPQNCSLKLRGDRRRVAATPVSTAGV